MKHFFRLVLTTLLLVPSLALADDDTAPAAPATDMAALFPLTYDAAEDAVSRALTDKGAGEKVAASINGRKSQPLYSYTKPVTAEIRGLSFEKGSGLFNANLFVMSGSDVVTAMPIGGRYIEMAEVPVLKHEVHNGETIGEADIEVRDFPEARVRTDTVTDIAGLIGMSPVRTISAGRPIREHEVSSPAVVKKNTMVQMRYRSPGMEITTSGQALEEGAKGDVIAVRNLASKKIVHATVEDSGVVSVSPEPQTLSQTEGAGHVED